MNIFKTIVGLSLFIASANAISSEYWNENYFPESEYNWYLQRGSTEIYGKPSSGSGHFNFNRVNKDSSLSDAYAYGKCYCDVFTASQTYGYYTVDITSSTLPVGHPIELSVEWFAYLRYSIGSTKIYRIVDGSKDEEPLDSHGYIYARTHGRMNFLEHGNEEYTKVELYDEVINFEYMNRFDDFESLEFDGVFDITTVVGSTISFQLDTSVSATAGRGANAAAHAYADPVILVPADISEDIILIQNFIDPDDANYGENRDENHDPDQDTDVEPDPDNNTSDDVNNAEAGSNRKVGSNGLLSIVVIFLFIFLRKKTERNA